MIVMNHANTNPKTESTILKLNQIGQNPLVYGLTSAHPNNQNSMKAASYVFSTPKAHDPSMQQQQQPFLMATASTSSSSSSSSYRHHTGKALSYASSAINPTPTLNNSQQVYNPLVTLTSTNKDRLTYHGGSSKNYYKTSEITDAIGLNNSMESIDNLIAATNLKSQRQSAFHAPKPKIQYKVAQQQQQQQAPVITTYANTKTIDALTKSLSTTSATTVLATNRTPSTMNQTNYSYTNKMASRSQYDNNNIVIDFIVDQKLRNPKTKRNHNPYMSNTVDYDDFDVDMLNGQQHCVEQPKYLNNPNGLSSTTGDSSLLLVNSLQLFSHFDVQSMLFNYNEIKLHKDSLHVSLNIRTGASAASRQSSMENINKALNANSSTSSESSTSSSTSSSSSTNGIMLNGTTSRFGCTTSSSLRQRPSMSSPRSSLVVTTTAAAINFTSPHLCETNQACNQQVSNDLVENCPMFKNEIGGDTFRGLGLVNESQRRFMKLNSITLLDKVNNSYRKDLIDVIESNNNEPFSIEYQDYGAFFYRYYFFNQDHSNYLGIDKDIGPVAISLKRDKQITIDNNQHRSEYVYRFIMRTSELYTLRGTIAEDHIPTKSSVSSSKGLSHKDLITYLVSQLDTNCLKLADTKANEKLMQLDEQYITKNYKIGVLLCKTSQSTEEEMYNNRESTPAFDEFLQLLGDRVCLKGFNHYKGGLDTKTDTTGTHSIYTKFRDKEIMFHVSTLLPFTVNDKQQLTRKRHIGNDVVTIVFQEPGSLPFSPKSIRSHYQHIFIIVRAINPNTANTQYSVAISYNRDIPAFGPPLPVNPLFVKSKEFREFLLVKILNADNAGLKCEKFTQMNMRARNGILKDLALDYVTKTSLDSSHKFGLFSFGSIKQKKSRSKSLQIFNASDTVQLTGGIFWTADVADGRNSYNCHFGIAKQAVIAVSTIHKCPVFCVPCNAIIGWTKQNDDNSLVLYFDMGEYIQVHLRSKLELQQVIKRLENFTEGCNTIELSLDKKDCGPLGFSIHHDGVVTEVEQYSLAYYRGLKQGTRILKICDFYVRELSHEKMIELLRKSLFLKVSFLPPFDDGSPRRGKDESFSIYSYLSTCSSVNERSIDLTNTTTLPKISNLQKMHSMNKSIINLNSAPVQFKNNYYKYDSLTDKANNEIQRINSSNRIFQQEDTRSPSLPTTPSTATSTRSSMNTSPTLLLTTTLAKAASMSNTHLALNNNLNNKTNLRHAYETDLDYSPPTTDKQHHNLAHSNSSNKLNISTNFDWTKLVQTATKAFENVHRSSDALYYTELGANNGSNDKNTNQVDSLKDYLSKTKMELDQEKFEKQKLKTKLDYYMDENATLKREVNKLRDENKILNQKLVNYINNINGMQ